MKHTEAETTPKPNLSAVQWQRLRQLVQAMDDESGEAADRLNNRSADRIELAIPVHIIWSDEHRKTYEAWVMARNISLGGISLVIRRMFHPGDRVRVDLPQPEAADRRIAAEVVFCRYVADMQHEIGLRFLPTRSGSSG